MDPCLTFCLSFVRPLASAEPPISYDLFPLSIVLKPQGLDSPANKKNMDVQFIKGLWSRSPISIGLDKPVFKHISGLDSLNFEGLKHLWAG